MDPVTEQVEYVKLSDAARDLREQL